VNAQHERDAAQRALVEALAATQSARLAAEEAELAKESAEITAAAAETSLASLQEVANRKDAELQDRMRELLRAEQKLGILQDRIDEGKSLLAQANVTAKTELNRRIREWSDDPVFDWPKRSDTVPPPPPAP